MRCVVKARTFLRNKEVYKLLTHYRSQTWIRKPCTSRTMIWVYWTFASMPERSSMYPFLSPINNSFKNISHRLPLAATVAISNVFHALQQHSYNLRRVVTNVLLIIFIYVLLGFSLFLTLYAVLRQGWEPRLGHQRLQRYPCCYRRRILLTQTVLVACSASTWVFFEQLAGSLYARNWLSTARVTEGVASWKQSCAFPASLSTDSETFWDSE